MIIGYGLRHWYYCLLVLSYKYKIEKVNIGLIDNTLKHECYWWWLRRKYQGQKDITDEMTFLLVHWHWLYGSRPVIEVGFSDCNKGDGLWNSQCHKSSYPLCLSNQFLHPYRHPKTSYIVSYNVEECMGNVSFTPTKKTFIVHVHILEHIKR